MIDFQKVTALFGGSFDPIHEGHLHVAREVQSAIPALQQILFVPAFHSPGKYPISASAEQRLEWLNLAVLPAGFGIWNLELERKGESYTVHTLEQARHMGAVKDRLYLIMGSDAYAGFNSWKSPKRIRELCRLVVVGRSGESISTGQKEDLFLPIPPHPASSSEIRSQLASGSLSRWLPAPVRAHLEKILPLHNPYVRKI